MLLSLLGSALLGCLGVVTAISSPECSNAPYKELLRLSTYPPALSFCSARFPLPPCTSTKISSSTVQLTVYTTSTSTVAVTKGTIVVSKVSTIDTTVTLSTTDATVSQAVATVTILTTVTLQQRKRAPAKSPKTTSSIKTTAKTSSSPSKSTSASTGLASIWASCEAAGLSVIAQACTCIETQPPCKTVTSVTTQTLPPTTLPTVSTVTTSVEATTTTTGLTTESSTITIDVTQTISVTATTTVEVDIPFYTFLGEYDPGCYFADYSNVEDTPDLLSSQSSLAITFCETFCTGLADCEAVFVQYLYPDPADVPTGSYTRWVCWYAETNSFYTGADSISCQPPQPVGVYGTGYLYQNARFTGGP